MENCKVVVFGLGYVGLPTASLVAHAGHSVLGVDPRARSLSGSSEFPFASEEPGLEDIFSAARHRGLLRISEEPEEADVFLICVPTPLVGGSSQQRADLSSLMDVADSLSSVVQSGNLVLIESTSPPGTTSEFRSRLSANGVDTESIFFAYCPERVLPGNIIQEVKTNARLVGGLSDEASFKAKEFYETFTSGEIRTTEAIVAELAKLTENSFRDVNIAFANEISMLASSFGVNDLNLIELTNLHPRVNILNPGPGVGGHCVAVDPWFLVEKRSDLTPLIQTARQVNDSKADWIVAQVSAYVTGQSASLRVPISDFPILCLGLSYKPDSSDIRESRALYVCRQLAGLGFNISAVEPNCEEIAGIRLVSFEHGVATSNLIIGLVRHREFSQPGLLDSINLEFFDYCGFSGAGVPSFMGARSQIGDN